MNPIIEVTPTEVSQGSALFQAEHALPLDRFRRDEADLHAVNLDEQGAILARCSIWMHDTPQFEGRQVGVLGHYFAASATAAGELLEHCSSRLAKTGYSLAVGPMDGNTWRSYRLITERGNEPRFFLEPDHPAAYAAQFRSAGFFELASYVSSLVTELDGKAPAPASRQSAIDALGVRIRQLDGEHLERDLKSFYDVAKAAFRSGFLYTPIGWEAFVELYRPLLGQVDPRFVLLAEHHHQAVGFIFGVPDHHQASRGEAIDTLIIKTLAVLPDRRYAGLGTLLLHRCHQGALAQGYRRVVHALMHEDNRRVQRLSRRFGTPFRRYALFARNLHRQAS